MTTNPYVIGGVFFGSGVLAAAWDVVTVSLRQRITPDRLLGRVNGAYRLLAWGSVPLGAAAGGLLAELFGLRAVFAVMGVAALLLPFGMLRVTDAAIDAAEREADRPAHR